MLHLWRWHTVALEFVGYVGIDLFCCGDVRVGSGFVTHQLLGHPAAVVATENRIRDGADAAMGYPRFGMLDLLKLLSGLLVGLFRSHAAREAETAFLRQQLVVLKRSAPARLRLRTADRLIFVWLYPLCPSVREA